jgi:hypothetical protein
MSSETIQQRPGLVTAVAVLNFIFGGLGLLGALCLGVAVGGLAALVSNAPAPKPGEPDLKDFFKIFTDIPGYVPFAIASVVMGLIMAIVLLVSGFGLLKLRNWARILCFIYATYTILSVVGGSVYQYTVVQPAMEKGMADWQNKMQAQMKGPGGARPAPPPQNPMGQAGGVVGGIVGSMFSIAYAVALFVILNLPDVKRAFATGGLVTRTDDRVAEEWDRGPDRDRPYGDEGRGRLRSDDDRIAPGEP